MSVIVTDMDMPSSCTMCDYSTCEDVFTHGHCDKLDDDFVINDYRHCRLNNCPMKSIEGLIDAIHKRANSGQWNEAVIFGIGLAVKVIKDYCEVSECE